MSTAIVIGYVREMVDDPPGTVEQQVTEMREYARVRLPGLAYQDTLVDAPEKRRVPLRSRWRGSRIIVSTDRGDHVVIARYSRGFANLHDLADTLHVLAAFGMHIHVLDLGLTPLTPEGRAVALACRRLAEAEKVLAKEVGTAQFRSRRLAGQALNGNAPPCFRYVGRRGKRRIVQDPYARQIAARVLHWRQAGWSYERVYYELLHSGVRKPNGKEYSLSGLRRLCEVELALQAREAAAPPTGSAAR
jgi:DNA invertase Pin-like site-specific DNA recombinase